MCSIVPGLDMKKCSMVPGLDMNKWSMAPALKGVSNKTGNKGLQARFVIGFSRF